MQTEGNGSLVNARRLTFLNRVSEARSTLSETFTADQEVLKRPKLRGSGRKRSGRDKPPQKSGLKRRGRQPRRKRPPPLLRPPANH